MITYLRPLLVVVLLLVVVVLVVLLLLVPRLLMPLLLLRLMLMDSCCWLRLCCWLLLCSWLLLCTWLLLGALKTATQPVPLTLNAVKQMLSSGAVPAAMATVICTMVKM